MPSGSKGTLKCVAAKGGQYFHAGSFMVQYIQQLAATAAATEPPAEATTATEATEPASAEPTKPAAG